MIESNIIYDFEDFKALILDKSKEGAFYLIYDEIYFEEIKRNQNITREIYAVAGKYFKSINIIKYANFKVKDDYTTKEISQFIESLKKHTIILATIFNPNEKDCFLLFISNRDDSKLEKEIKNLLEMEN